MPNYYEILQVVPSATIADIESACEERYHRWRRLVTHHDPETADKAARALRILEQIRTTLTDPVKRAAYDATLDLDATLSGLADPLARRPTSSVPAPAPPPPAPAQTTSSAGPPARLDAWICPNCHTASPIGTRFCRHCGNEIARNCPKCDKVIEKTIRFCPECGVEVEAYIAQKEREAAEQERRRQEEAQRREEERAAYEAREKQRKKRRNRIFIYMAGIFTLIVFCGIVLSRINELIQQQRYKIQATATVEQQYANVTATAEQQHAKATATIMARLAAVTATTEAWLADGYELDDYSIPMVHVPAGGFVMGTTGFGIASPPHYVEVETFWIDVYEITYANYGKCVDAGVCSIPRAKKNYQDYEYAEYPIINITWGEADKYCRWRGGRLPTEAEWEYAARGEHASKYPWGNSDSAIYGIYVSDTYEPVGRYPEGKSWIGVYDMAGSVWEWTQDSYAQYPGSDNYLDGCENSKMIRGGAWNSSNYTYRSTHRKCLFPQEFSVEFKDNLGFRCMKPDL